MTHKNFFIAPLLVLLAAGCGGGGASSGGSTPPDGRGTGTFTIHWPERTRLIPTSSNCIAVDLLLKGEEVSHQIVPRPQAPNLTSTVNFSDLPYGTYGVNVTAYPSDGSKPDNLGTPQAVGRGSMTITEDTPGTASVSLTSTVARLTITPATVDKGKAVDIIASATDASGNIVALQVGDAKEPLTWSVASPSIATLTGAGPKVTLTGTHSGNTTVTVSMVTNDKGNRVTSTPTTVKVNPIDDGTGVVIIQ